MVNVSDDIILNTTALKARPRCHATFVFYNQMRMPWRFAPQKRKVEKKLEALRIIIAEYFFHNNGRRRLQ